MGLAALVTISFDSLGSKQKLAHPNSVSGRTSCVGAQPTRLMPCQLLLRRRKCGPDLMGPALTAVSRSRGIFLSSNIPSLSTRLPLKHVHKPFPQGLGTLITASLHPNEHGRWRLISQRTWGLCQCSLTEEGNAGQKSAENSRTVGSIHLLTWSTP